MNFWGWVSKLLDTYWPMFVKGAYVTFILAVVGTAAGFAIGLLIGIVRTLPLRRGGEKGFTLRYAALKVVNALLVAYIEIFRGTPMMVQAIVMYYGLLEAFRINLSSMAAGFLVISLNTGAYMAEIVRSGIQSVDKGQSEAAKAIGMTHWQTMMNVVLPQAVRNILPSCGNEFIINIKDSSVLNVISVGELFFMATSVKGVALRTYETFFITAIIYLVLTFSFTRLLAVLEKHLDGPKDFSLAAGTAGAKGGRM